MLHTMSPAFPFAHDKVIHDIYCQSKSLFCYVAQIYWILYRCRFLSIIYLCQMTFECFLSSWGWLCGSRCLLRHFFVCFFFVCMFRKCYTLHDSSVQLPFIVDICTQPQIFKSSLNCTVAPCWPKILNHVLMLVALLLDQKRKCLAK